MHLLSINLLLTYVSYLSIYLSIYQSTTYLSIFLIYLSMSRYGGPGTQTVDQRWGVGWDTYLASKRNFIVAQLDVRGSGFQVILPLPSSPPAINCIYLPPSLILHTLPFHSHLPHPLLLLRPS